MAGLLAGVINGLFGAGGGIVLVPLLRRWVGLSDRETLASSVAIILPVSLLSGLVYWNKNGMDMLSAWPFLAGGLVGGLIGGKVLRRIPVTWLQRAFGLLLLYGGVRYLLG